jgi:hypothetical protein
MAQKGNARENFRIQKEKTGHVTRFLGKSTEKDRQYTLKKKQKKTMNK